MSKRIPTGITREFLEGVALPNHGGRYTPISHKSIIDKVHAELAARGFNVEAELYRASMWGNVANGMYILDQGTDPDMKMMFVWGNSYDKTMRFKCGIGVYIPKTDNYIFAGNIASYARKHTGNADQEALEMIQTHLNMANAHYTELVSARDMLINSTVSIRKVSELVGRMFIEENCLNKEQASAVRDRIMNKVELFDNLPWNNAWNFYNSVAGALRQSHPKSWFEDQSTMHSLIVNEVVMQSYTETTQAPDEVVELSEVISESEIPTNQLDLLQVIDEIEAEKNWQDKVESPSDVIVEEVPEELFTFEAPETTTFELPDL